MQPAETITDPAVCIVHTGTGERPSEVLAGLLRPVNPATFHIYRLEANRDVELHYHDFDEYWWFVEGRPRVTIRLPNGVKRDFHLGPLDLVACVRGVEHTLWADHEVVYMQYSSVRLETDRKGHLTRP